jgi:hypothetical protein
MREINNLQAGFEKWKAGHHFTISLLNFLKKIFYIPDYFKIESSFNKEAGNKFIYNFTEFKKEVEKCILLSQKNKHKNCHDSSIKVCCILNESITYL